MCVVCVPGTCVVLRVGCKESVLCVGCTESVMCCCACMRTGFNHILECTVNLHSITLNAL